MSDEPIVPTPEQIRGLATDLGPLQALTTYGPSRAKQQRIAALLADDQAVDRLVARAQNDIEVFLGQRDLDATLLSDEQCHALVRATMMHALFLLVSGGNAELGVDDRITSDGRLSFADRSRRRLSPRVAELLTGYGLIRRSGAVQTTE